MLAYLSRVTHTLSNATIFSYAIAPYFWVQHDLKLAHPIVMPVLALLSVLSGLYNASLARPSRFKAQASAYRLSVYVKLPFILIFTPLVARVFTDDNAKLVRLVVAVAMFLLGARAKFIREGQLLVKQ